MSFRKQLKATFRDVFGGAKDTSKPPKESKKQKGQGQSPYTSASTGSPSSFFSKSSPASAAASKVSLSLRGRFGGDAGGPPPPPVPPTPPPPPPPPPPKAPPSRSDTAESKGPPPRYETWEQKPAHTSSIPPAAVAAAAPTPTPTPSLPIGDTPYRAWDRALLQLSSSERRDLLSYHPSFSASSPSSSSPNPPPPQDEHALITTLLHDSHHLLHQTESRAWTFTNPFTGAAIPFKQKLASFISRLETYVKIGDIAVQHSPEVTALVWAGVRFLMTVVVSDAEMWAMVVETMEAVAGVMGRCRIYERMYSSGGGGEGEGGGRVMEALVGLYANILVFSVKTKRYFAKSNRKRMLTSAVRPYQVAFGPVMEGMKRWEEKVEKEARAAAEEGQWNERLTAQTRHAETSGRLDELKAMLERLRDGVGETSEVVRKVRRAQEEEERLAILQWLSTVKYVDNHRTMVKVRQEGTGGWLFERGEWRRWMGKDAGMGFGEVVVEKEWWNEPLVGEDGKVIEEEDGDAGEVGEEVTSAEEKPEEKTVGGLWLHGLPGTGKTILTSLIIDHLSTQIHPKFPSPPTPSSLLAYFYCSYTEAGRKTSTSFLATILKQLSLSLNPQPENDPSGLGLPNTLVTAYREAKQQGFSTAHLDLKEMEDIIFKEILPSTGLKRVYIVIDALDEMEEKSRKELYPIFERLLGYGGENGEGCKVKMFAASRAGQRDVKLALGKEALWARMGLAKEDTGGDIRRYVEVQTQSAIEGGDLLEGEVDEELKREITERLVKGAEGMFLWVRYQIANLCEQETEHDVHEALKNLPAGIEETYAALLSKINTQSPSRKRLAERVLQWMICANRPLTPRELVEAVAIDVRDTLGIDPKKMAKGVEAIVDVCGNLISYDENLGVLRFVHFTVQEFLEKRFMGVQEASLGVAEVCVTLLCFENGWRLAAREDVGSFGKLKEEERVVADDKSGDAGTGEGGGSNAEDDDSSDKKPPPGRFSTLPPLALAEYAVLNWGLHSRTALSASQSSSPSLATLVTKFLSQDSPFYHFWITTLTKLTNTFSIHIMDSQAEKTLPNQLFISAYYSLPHTFVQQLIKLNPTVLDPYPGTGWTQFHLAAATSCPDVLTYLSEFYKTMTPEIAAVDVNATDRCNQTPLHIVAASRRTSRGGNYIWLSPEEAKIVHILLQHGCDVNLKDGKKGDTAFHVACETGNLSVLRALCVETIPAPPFPVTYPSKGGVVKLTTLLEKKLNTFGMTPLHVACLSKWIMFQAKKEVVLHLLPLAGHDVNARDSFGFTPAERVLRDVHGRECGEVLQLLYDCGGVWDVKKPGLAAKAGQAQVKEWGRGAFGGIIFHGLGVASWRVAGGVGMGAMPRGGVDPRLLAAGGRGKFDRGYVERCRRWCESSWGEEEKKEEGRE